MALRKRIEPAYDYKCDLCFQYYQNDKGLKKHQSSYTPVEPPGPVRCPQCDEEYPSKAVLKRHRATHFCKKKQIKCWVCNVVFADVFEVEQHEYDSHNAKGRHRSSVWSCKECHSLFGSVANLATHMKSHTRYKISIGQTECIPCRKTFCSKAELRQHQTQFHDRPHECGVCQETYPNWLAKQRHWAECRPDQDPDDGDSREREQLSKKKKRRTLVIVV